MLKRFLFALSVLSLLGLVIEPFAMAQPRDKRVRVNRSVHVNRTVHVNRNVRVSGSRTRYVVGRHYHGHVWYGRNRHFWHGRWYAYGVGPCWKWSYRLDGYVWVCGYDS